MSPAQPPQVAPYIADGQLVPLLQDWVPRFPGRFIYYPSRRRMPATLRALIEFLRGRGRSAA